MQFSASSKHRQTLRYVNSLEDTLNELNILLEAKSAFVCAAHGQLGSYKFCPLDHRISLKDLHRPERKDPTDQVLCRLPSQLNATANANRYSNVVQKKTLLYGDIKDLGDSLSFVHSSDTESVTSSELDQEGESGMW